MNDQAIQEKSCGLVVLRDTPKGKEYLLLHYPAGHWDFPKGHVEPGESERQTALREMEEETGIKDVSIIDGFRDTIHYYFRHDGQLISKTVVFFCAQTTENDVTISHEHQDHQWLPFKEAMARLTFDNAKGILQQVYNFLQAKQ